MSEALKKSIHTAYIGTMTLIVIITTVYLSYVGYDYYNTPLEERFYAPNHDWFKPSGAYGHGLGIVGTLMILFGVVIYILRKRYNFLSSFIRLKYLLEFHIFLCLLGPILVLFHTAFKIWRDCVDCFLEHGSSRSEWFHWSVHLCADTSHY